jgi:hypothetical protein
LLVANDKTGVELYDIRNRKLPVLIDEFEYSKEETAAQSVYQHEGYIYVPSWDGGLYIFELTGEEPDIEKHSMKTERS